MGHIAHLRKQFKSINTFDYIITLIKRRKKINFMITYCFFIWILTQRCYVPKLVEIGSLVLEKRLFLISSMYFRYFCNNLLHPRMHCDKFGWKWPSGSGEEDFWILSMFFHYFVIICPWKSAVPFVWINLNSLHPRMLFAKFGEIGSVVL